MDITNKYQNEKIYKIVDISYNKCYIGSTCEKLCHRMARHRLCYKTFLNYKKTIMSSYELFKEYGVECIIRIGTAGSYHPHIKLYDVINVDVACSESTFAKYAFDIDGNLITHQGNAFDIINETAEEKGMPLLTGAIHSSDIFYRKKMDNPAIVAEYNCLAVEMEAFALFANAKFLGKTASTLLTISDVIPTHEQISADAREKSLNPMIELALESAIRFQKSL